MGKSPANQSPTAMRPAVIKGTIERHKARDKQSIALVERRNDAMRALNREFGFQDRDGHYSNGSRSSEPSYVKRVEAIEAPFRKVYDALLPDSIAEDRATLSVYEYLVLDNAGLGADEYLLEYATSMVHEPWADFVKARAVGDVRSIAARYETLKDITRLVEFQRTDFGFRARRCRKLYSASPFGFTARCIAWFRRDYLRHLQAEFDALRVR